MTNHYYISTTFAIELHWSGLVGILPVGMGINLFRLENGQAEATQQSFQRTPPTRAVFFADTHQFTRKSDSSPEDHSARRNNTVFCAQVAKQKLPFSHAPDGIQADGRKFRKTISRFMVDNCIYRATTENMPFIQFPFIAVPKELHKLDMWSASRGGFRI
jgi:hypothetical protein